MEIYREMGSITQPFRFPGQYFDEETGLDYNYFRDYNPEVGRFLTPDPSLMPNDNPNIPFLLYQHLETPQALNLFGYVGNNPVNKVDPEGLFGITGPGFKNIRPEESLPCKSPYDECVEKAKKYREICIKALWIAQAKCIALCAIGCVGSTMGYPACLTACDLACHEGFKWGRRGCWIAYIMMVKSCNGYTK